jgi:hypothetical protein
MSIIQGNAHTSAGGGGFNVERSLRFNSADTAYLSRTGGTSTNRKIHTFSFWTKYSVTGGTGVIASAGSDDNNREWLGFDSNKFSYQIKDSGSFYDLGTTQVFRDPSAWYHIVVAIDTAQATASNRVKIYVNGSQITAFSSTQYPPQNDDLFFNDSNGGTSYIGVLRGFVSSSFAYNGYLTEFYFIDGQALTPSDFGETDSATGVWKPKAYSGTYGTNGFYLSFSDNTSTTTLGYDDAGSNDWTTNNFSVTAGAGNDSLVDSPTAYGTDTGVGGSVRGNYCTVNPLDKSSGATLSNGNLNIAAPANDWLAQTRATIGVSSGKWYWEIQQVGAGNFAKCGVRDNAAALTSNTTSSTGSEFYFFNGNKQQGATNASYGSGLSGSDNVVGVALDMDNGKIWWSINGTFQASGDPAAGTDAAFTNITGTQFPTTSSYNTALVANFGQRPFAYTAPSGFKALVTTNLPTPTIGATSTTQANDYFNVVTYTGTLSTVGSNQLVTGVGFQPDMTWIKCRSNAADNIVADAIRYVSTADNNYLVTNSTAAEADDQNTFRGFASDGFNVGYYDVTGNTGKTYVAWNWNAGGSNATNTAGTITSTVRANTTSGFSIVTFNIPASGTSDTVGHGLGVAPSMVILKPRTADTSWGVYHSGLTSAAYYLTLQTTNAQASSNSWWNSTAPTSSVFTIGATWYGTTNAVAYCFAPVAGYSAFGSYTGNGSSDGVFVYTGFRPSFILTKRTDSANYWMILDDERRTYNPAFNGLYPNLSDAEGNFGNSTGIDFLSNGFKLRDSVASVNASGGTYIYMAIAESPFKFSLGR